MELNSNIMTSKFESQVFLRIFSMLTSNIENFSGQIFSVVLILLPVQRGKIDDLITDKIW